MAFLDENGLAELWAIIKKNDDAANTNANSRAKIQTGTYSGTGTYGSGNKNKLTLNFNPLFVICGKDTEILLPQDVGWNASGIIWIKGMATQTRHTTGSTSTDMKLTFSTGTNTLSWYNSKSATYQANASGTTYRWVAIG